MQDSCADATYTAHPCEQNPLRVSFSQEKCSIIKSDVFEACHALVDPTKYYDNCYYDTCGCNIGGDCECFCTNVAAYAQVNDIY